MRLERRRFWCDQQVSSERNQTRDRNSQLHRPGQCRLIVGNRGARVHYSSDRCHSERSEESRINCDACLRIMDRDVGKLGLMLRISLRRSAQHDSAIISCFQAVDLFLRSDRVFLKTRRVGVGEIRRILVGLIEHFSSAARISAVLLDQGSD